MLSALPITAFPDCSTGQCHGYISSDLFTLLASALPLAVTVENNFNLAYPPASGILEHLPLSCASLFSSITIRPSPTVLDPPWW